LPCGAQKTQNPPREVLANHAGNLGGAVSVTRSGRGLQNDNGKEYKNAEVSRVEPDGIVLRTKSGISKLYFTELPKEVQERFHYNPAHVAAQSRENANVAATSGIEGLPPFSVELKDQILNALKMTD